MTRFPVLTTVGYILRGAAILCAIVGFIVIGKAGLVGFIGFEAVALSLWVYAEVTGVVLAIEDNTYETKQALRSLAQALERGALASSTPSAPVQSGWTPSIPAPRPASSPNRPARDVGSLFGCPRDHAQ